MRVLQAFAVASLLTAASAAEAVTYTFAAAPNNGWSPFAVTFYTPTLLREGDPLPPIAFTVTNGNFSYLINTSANTGLGGVGHPGFGSCVLFGTGDQDFFAAATPCSIYQPPPGNADMLFFYDRGLPQNEGTYRGRSLTIVAGDAPGGTDFNAVITVSNVPAVPEPATWAMMIGGFTMVGGVMRRRRPAQVAG